MRIVTTLGVLAGGFLLSPPPKSVITTLLWLGVRIPPALTAIVILAVLMAWRVDHDNR